MLEYGLGLRTLNEGRGQRAEGRGQRAQSKGDSNLPAIGQRTYLRMRQNFRFGGDFKPKTKINKKPICGFMPEWVQVLCAFPFQGLRTVVFLCWFYFTLIGNSDRFTSLVQLFNQPLSFGLSCYCG